MTIMRRISITEVAKRLGVCWLTARRWLETGLVPGWQVYVRLKGNKAKYAVNAQVFEKWWKSESGMSEKIKTPQSS